MNNTRPEVPASSHDWRGGLPANEYYAIKQKAKRLRGDYTEEQLDVLDQMEKAWRASLPILSLKELVDIYPGSEKAAKRGLKARMNEVKEQMSGLSAYRDIWHDTVINKASFRDQRELANWLNEKCEGYLKEYQREMKSLHLLMRSLETTPSEVVTSSGITDEMIALAKQVPISSLIKVRRDGKALCVWHKEKTPSMHVFKKDNHVHCFGCARTGDAIAVYMAVNGLPFTESVKKML